MGVDGTLVDGAGGVAAEVVLVADADALDSDTSASELGEAPTAEASR